MQTRWRLFVEGLAYGKFDVFDTRAGVLPNDFCFHFHRVCTSAIRRGTGDYRNEAIHFV